MDEELKNAAKMVGTARDFLHHCTGLDFELSGGKHPNPEFITLFLVSSEYEKDTIEDARTKVWQEIQAFTNIISVEKYHPRDPLQETLGYMYKMKVPVDEIIDNLPTGYKIGIL